MNTLEETDELFRTLRRYDTPTVCNAIEVAQGRRGFDAFTKNTFIATAPGAAPIVGYARTAKIAGAHPPEAAAAVIRERRMSYYRHMAAGPRPAVTVIQDEDGPHCVAAWWGEVHAAIHSGLGIAGAITNGVVRDLGELDPDYPILAGSVGPSHGYCHVREFGTPVEIFGLSVNDGDLLHADRHGAIVIPPAVLPDLKNAIAKLIDTEQIVLRPARDPDFNIEKLEAAWTAFEKART